MLQRHQTQPEHDGQEWGCDDQEKPEKFVGSSQIDKFGLSEVKGIFNC
jgi:hypothetical protein